MPTKESDMMLKGSGPLVLKSTFTIAIQLFIQRSKELISLKVLSHILNITRCKLDGTRYEGPEGVANMLIDAYHDVLKDKDGLVYELDKSEVEINSLTDRLTKLNDEVKEASKKILCLMMSSRSAWAVSQKERR
ncbi:hypothetical protein HAX54_038988 [Datura stramonium]|uniref:Uncharacterized protein n=1 Tax=Datura stramonium TaxID=4076 RepID=A0ABS8SIT2_DATST|nr:hypothetical protein [Datura stramonium]